MEKLVNLCKRRGIIFPSSDIYGGLGSTWDYGPLGVELKRNVKEAWWREMVQRRSDVMGLDAAILMHPRTWEASGHLQSFTDPLVDCKSCKQRFRADHLDSNRCPECGGELTEARNFNLMFKTFMGPVEDTASTVYLRPETAQGIFVNFRQYRRYPARQAALWHRADRQILSQRDHAGKLHLPHPRVRADGDGVLHQSPTRPRKPNGSSTGWSSALAGTSSSGSTPSICACGPMRATSCPITRAAPRDIEFLYPFGWGELEGVAKRGSYDLDRHAEFSGKDLTYFEEETKSRFRPWVIEPAAGVDRALLAFLLDSYDEDVVENEERIVLRLDPRLAPVKAAVFPLLRKGGQPEKAQEVLRMLQKHFNGRLRPGRLDRPALPAPRRSRHSVCADHRSSDHGGRHRHPARSRLHGSAARLRSAPWCRNSKSASAGTDEPRGAIAKEFSSERTTCGALNSAGTLDSN